MWLVELSINPTLTIPSLSMAFSRPAILDAVGAGPRELLLLPSVPSAAALLASTVGGGGAGPDAADEGPFE
jgi:hypothetical protein